MLTLYHNPGCSKSREALALLQARGVALQVHDYLTQPLDPAQLQALCSTLNLPVRSLLRSGEATYSQLGLADKSLSEAALLAAIAAHPHLLQRPIVTDGEHAVIARPPELALSLLPPQSLL